MPFSLLAFFFFFPHSCGFLTYTKRKKKKSPFLVICILVLCANQVNEDGEGQTPTLP